MSHVKIKIEHYRNLFRLFQYCLVQLNEKKMEIRKTFIFPSDRCVYVMTLVTVNVSLAHAAKHSEQIHLCL